MVAYILATLWPTPGFLVFVKLMVLGLVILGGFLLLGEFSAEEIAQVRSMLRWRKGTPNPR